MTVTVQANVAQMVERQLPKLDVAGSIPVIRSFLFRGNLN